MSRGDWDSRSSGRGTRRGDDSDEDVADQRARQGTRRSSPPASSSRDDRYAREGRSTRDGGDVRGDRGDRGSGRDMRDDRSARDPRSRRDPREDRGEREYDDRRGGRPSSRDGSRVSSRRPSDGDGWDDRSRSGSRGAERSRYREDAGPGSSRGSSREGDRSMSRGQRPSPSRSGTRWEADSMEAPRARRGTPPVAPSRGGRPGPWGEDDTAGGRGRDPRAPMGGMRGARVAGRPGARSAAKQPQSSGKAIAIMFGLIVLGLVLGSGAGAFYFYKLEKVPTPPATSSAISAAQASLAAHGPLARVSSPTMLLVNI